MRAYFSLWKVRFLTLIQYRSAAAAGIATQIVFGMIYVMAMHAFYEFSSDGQSISLQQSINFIWINQALLGMLPWRLEPEIAQSVRSSQVAYELTRPMDLYNMWYARCLAQLSAPTLLKSIPQFLINGLLFPPMIQMAWPEIPVLMGWLVALLGAWMLAAAIVNLLNISLFWTVSGEGIARAVPAVVMLFSGVHMPYLPEVVQRAVRWLPFYGVADGPTRLFSGMISLESLPQLLFVQGIWIILLVMLGRVLVRVGLRRVTIAGG